MTPKHRFNCRPESHYRRSLQHPMAVAPDPKATITLPDTGTLKASGLVPSPYDQGVEGSCTANGWSMGLDVIRAVSKFPAFSPSRQYIYARERIMNGDLSTDAGANVGDGALVLKQFGVCSDATWPYLSTDEFTAPTPVADAEAASHKLLSYASLACTPEALCIELAQGRPCVFGFDVPQSFEDEGAGSVAATGIMQAPKAGEPSLGGHCVVALDYVLTQRGSTYTAAWYQKLIALITRKPLGGGFDGYLWCLNSWGSSWGQAGYFQMPFAVFSQLAFDPYGVYAASA